MQSLPMTKVRAALLLSMAKRRVEEYASIWRTGHCGWEILGSARTKHCRFLETKRSFVLDMSPLPRGITVLSPQNQKNRARGAAAGSNFAGRHFFPDFVCFWIFWECLSQFAYFCCCALGFFGFFGLGSSWSFPVRHQHLKNLSC